MPFLTAVAVALCMQGPPAQDVPEKYKRKPPTASTVVARVNGAEITAGQVEPYLWDWWGADATQDLITSQLVRAEADKMRVDVSDQEVEAAVDGFLADFQKKIQPGASIDAALASQGMTRSRLYMRFRPQLLVQKLLQREFVPATLVKVSTIVFRASSAQTTALSEAIKKADDAYSQLSKGVAWDVVFKQYTTDARVLGTKGLIGWRSIAAFPESVAAELKTLKPGQVTKPAQTDNGIQIFRLEVAGKDAKGKDFDEMKQAYMDGGRMMLMNRLQKESKIERLWPPN